MLVASVGLRSLALALAFNLLPLDCPGMSPSCRVYLFHSKSENVPSVSFSKLLAGLLKIQAQTPGPGLPSAPQAQGKPGAREGLP